jgi:MerR family copper efflux transcriptional regulator
MYIKELENRTGLTRHTIRFYEKQGLLLQERSFRRQGNTYRDYSEETVGYLKMLKAGQAAGFTLAEIKELLHEDEAKELPLQKKVEVLRHKMQEIDRRKAALDQMQTYLAQMVANKLANKLAWSEDEEQGTAHG